MTIGKAKRPRRQLAKQVFDIAIGEAETISSSFSTLPAPRIVPKSSAVSAPANC